jgi:methyl-accepting chemotaxis protein
VNLAGGTMSEVVMGVTDIMSKITVAGQAQSAGIAQVNQAITQMDQVTQQNAALVEEAATAADSMQVQAQELLTVVSTFKIDSKNVGHVLRLGNAGLYTPSVIGQDLPG